MSESKILTEDLWSAIDALDALPETHETEWFLEASEPPHRQSLFSLVLLQGTGGGYTRVQLQVVLGRYIRGGFERGE